MLNYPLLPCEPNYDNNISATANVAEVNYGIGGVAEQAPESSINRSNSRISITVNVTNRAAVDQFLTGRAGQPFTISYDGVNNDGRIYRCISWEWTLLGVGAAAFSAEVVQNRRLQ